MGKEFTNIFTTLGASNHSDEKREDLDYYATDPVTLELLLKEEIFNNLIWEPASGGGHLIEELNKHGYKTISTDIKDYGCQDTIIDFLSITEPLPKNVDILTNPPYKHALAFVKKGLELVQDGARVIMFLRIAFLEGQERYRFFKENPPKYIYVLSNRFACAKNGEFIKDGKKIGSAISYAWFIWEKGFKGEPTIRWLKKPDESDL